MLLLSNPSALLQPETLRQLLTPSDLILLAICIVCFAYGYYRGLLHTVFGCVRGIAAFTLASFTARLCAPYLAEYIVTPIIGNVLEKKASTVLSGVINTHTISGGVNVLDGFRNLLDINIINAAAQPLQTAIAQVTHSMAQSLSYTLLFFVLFAVFGELLRILFHTLKILTKIGPISTLNHIGGGLLGLAGALVIILLIFIVLSVFSPATFSDVGALSPAVREKTLLTRTLYDFIVTLLPTA